MKNSRQKAIERLYRKPGDTYVLIAAIIIGLIFNRHRDNGLLPEFLTTLAMPAIIILSIGLAAGITARMAYRIDPFCPVCGLDAVDCKIRRSSLLNHPGQ